MFPAQTHVDRPGSYPRDDGLDFTGIDFPTPLSQISKIEEQNNLAITVFGWCEGKTVVVRVSEVEDPNTRPDSSDDAHKQVHYPLLLHQELEQATRQ